MEKLGIFLSYSSAIFFHPAFLYSKEFCFFILKRKILSIPLRRNLVILKRVSYCMSTRNRKVKVSTETVFHEIKITLVLYFVYLVLLPVTKLYWTEKAMAPHSSTLAWKISWTEEPGGLQSMGSLRVGHDLATSLSLFTFMHLRRKWQPTPVFLPGESQGQGSLVGCRLLGRTESDTTEAS